MYYFNRTQKPFLFACSLVLLCSLSAPCFSLEPNGIALGSGWSLYPSVVYAIIEDTNPYIQASSNEESATVTKIRPQVRLKLDSGVGLYSISYWLEQGAYSTNANDNYTDQMIEVAGLRALGRRLEVSAGVSYTLGHDVRGAGIDEGVTALEDVFYPDEYRDLKFDTEIAAGLDDSTLNFKYYVSFLDKNYLNNFERGTADREYQDFTAGGIVYLYVSPVTDALAEIRRSRIDYQSLNAVPQDKEGEVYTYLAGAKWDVSGKTTGSVKVGQTRRTFDSSRVKSNNSFSWEVALGWSPKTYSEVQVETTRGTKETSGPGVFVLSSDVSLTWLHRYSVFFGGEISVDYDNDDYFDEKRVQRTDDILSVKAKLIYSPSRSMDIGFSLGKVKRDSDQDFLDYKRTIYGVDLTLAI